VTRISEMRNLGLQMERWLAEADIANANDLRTIGSVEAWTRLRFIFGPRVSIIALHAMEGAILDCDWRKLPKGAKDRLHLLVGYNPRNKRNGQATMQHGLAMDALLKLSSSRPDENSVT
jgi:DNA transformation protein and related proteins